MSEPALAFVLLGGLPELLDPAGEPAASPAARHQADGRQNIVSIRKVEYWGDHLPGGYLGG